jgi:hypothetical protein
VRLDAETHVVSPDELVFMASHRVLPVAFCSWGPTRDTIVPCRKSSVRPVAVAA